MAGGAEGPSKYSQDTGLHLFPSPGWGSWKRLRGLALKQEMSLGTVFSNLTNTASVLDQMVFLFLGLGFHLPSGRIISSLGDCAKYEIHVKRPSVYYGVSVQL